MNETMKLIKMGILSSFPLALGYIPISITFGILSKSYAMPSYVPILMSLLIYAGSSQFVALQMMLLGSAPLQMILTVFIVNLRHFLLGTALTQKLPNDISGRKRGILAYFLTDEAFVYMMNRDAELTFPFMLGFQVTLFIAWVSGTVLGVFILKDLPIVLSLSLGIAIYALCISLLMPAIQRSKKIGVLCLFSGGLSYALSLTQLTTGWRIIIVTVVASFIGALFIKEEDNV